MKGAGWTVDELAQRAADTLASDGVHAPNGRVTAVPDRRMIRWYATLGLLDPPLRTRGRTARYGDRHLLQLVAVKRRQAEGRSIAQIQAELAGATDTTLRTAAGLPYPADPDAGSDPDPDPAPGLGRPHFWREATPAPASLVGTVRHDGHGSPDRAAPPDPVYPVPLPGGATLVLEVRPTGDDLAALHHAAQPLLDLLAARGLLSRPRPQAPAGAPPSRRS